MRMPGIGVGFKVASSIWSHAGHWLGLGHTPSWQVNTREESASSEHLYSTLATFKPVALLGNGKHCPQLEVRGGRLASFASA